MIHIGRIIPSVSIAPIHNDPPALPTAVECFALAVRGLVKQPPFMNAIVRGLSARLCISLLVIFAAVDHVSAQPSTDQTNSTPEQIAALQQQLTNAWHQVETIVNQPVPAFRREPGYDVSIYSPGWFHPGAIIPAFNTVDVRKSQELPYTSPWVSSDLTPNVMFQGRDLEFNSMTKLFYTNRSLPKKKLNEAEMEQINSLYRTIGHSQSEIQRLQNPPGSETAAPDTDAQSDTNDIVPGQSFEVVRRIPQQTRILYGGIGIGTLIVVVVALRLIKRKSD
jgi:hypothetical protein